MSGGRARPPLTILGAGPVGLIAAIRARQLGVDVEIRSNRMPSLTDPSRLEVIPAKLLALLVELGVPPRSVGVDRLHDRRLTQWRSSTILAEPAPRSAHIARPALELILLELADRVGVRIRSGIQPGEQWVRDGKPVLDATGRSAVTAHRVLRPKRPIVCRTFTYAVSSDELGRFAIVAGPEGYAYRLSNGLHATLGIVGNGGLLRGNACDVVAKIRAFAPWFADKFDPARFESGSTGVASLQWVEEREEGAHLIGDASLARDALASQGLALGIGDALRVVSEVAMRRARVPRPIEGSLEGHRLRVSDLIKASPFATAPMWRSYLQFLDVAGVGKVRVPRSQNCL